MWGSSDDWAERERTMSAEWARRSPSGGVGWGCGHDTVVSSSSLRVRTPRREVGYTRMTPSGQVRALPGVDRIGHRVVAVQSRSYCGEGAQRREMSTSRLRRTVRSFRSMRSRHGDVIFSRSPSGADDRLGASPSSGAGRRVDGVGW